MLRVIPHAQGYLSVAVHEFAHAAMARALGGRLRYVRLGQGRVRRVLRPRGLRVEIRCMEIDASSGQMQYQRRTRWTMKREIAVSLAGPIASLFWCALFFLVASRATWFYPFACLELWWLRLCEDDLRDAWDYYCQTVNKGSEQ